MNTVYYLITITHSSGKTISAVRVLPEEPIDKLWNQYQMKASGVYRDLRYFNIVLLSRYSQEVVDFLNKKNPNPPPPRIPNFKRDQDNRPKRQ